VGSPTYVGSEQPWAPLCKRGRGTESSSQPAPGQNAAWDQFSSAGGTWLAPLDAAETAHGQVG
jgi:hypothetical protein